MKVKFKNAFLKDIEKLPSNYRERIEKIVFDQIPRSDNLQMIKNLKKIRADNLYYRIRVGDYRIKGALKKLSFEASWSEPFLLLFFGIKLFLLPQSYEAAIKHSAISCQHPVVLW